MSKDIKIVNNVMLKKVFIFFIFFPLLIIGCVPNIEYDTLPFETPDGEIQVAFSVTADMRDYSGDNVKNFRGVCERIAFGGCGDFMVSLVDIDPPDVVYETIQHYIGTDYVWYPVVGNHEAETSSDMVWLRNFNPSGNVLPNIVNSGPSGSEETSYSFDYRDAHFVILNEYYNGTSYAGTDGDIVQTIYDWLVNDLEINIKPVVLVFGHEPAYPKPDEESGRLRHESDSLNAHLSNRGSFWSALVTYGVTAYICGHTHNYSTYLKDGVWQIDVGHARCFGDTGSRSTFVMFYVMGDRSVWYYTYRLKYETHNYVLEDQAQIR